MDNKSFEQMAKSLLGDNPNIKNMLNSPEGKILASKLNEMSKTNKSLNSVINSAKIGDISNAKDSLNTLLQTAEGKELAKTLSKILGNK